MRHADSLESLRDELEHKREFVARLEQERTDLELEIAGFEALYNAEVKPIQDELEAVKRYIQEYAVRNDLVRFRGNQFSPTQLEAEVESRLGMRRPDAETPPRQAPKWEGAPPSAAEPAVAEPQVVVKAELKSLYRELAKRFHPDLAANDIEREAHGRRMADINDAYARGDLDALRRAASQAGARANLPPTLAELLAERDRLDALIVRLRQDVAELNRDPLFLLKIDAALARRDGRNLLAEMATDLHIQLVERRGALNKLIAEFRALVEQAGLA
jgi:hypothetical protein